MLKTANISLTTDVKALHPQDPGWERKFISSSPANNIAYDIHSDSKPPVNNSVQKQKPVVDTTTLPPLHKAAYLGHHAKTKGLIQEGAAVNETGPNGWTPLHMAAIGGHRSLSEYLLKEGAEISAKDNSGQNPAKLANIFGHKGLEKFLREEQK